MEPQINEQIQAAPAPLKTNPLYIVTPVSKYLAMALFVILPFLGFWLGTLFAPVPQQQNTIVVNRPLVQKENALPPTTQTTVSSTSTYISKDGVFSIKYPANQVIQPIPNKQIAVMGGTATSTYPIDWIEIPNLFIVAKIPYTEMKKILDYESCCSGTEYSFDQVKKTWSAQTFAQAGSDEVSSVPKLLSTNGKCTIQKTIGKNIFSRIEQGDEGIATSYHYFLMTDQGYALRFTSKFDLDPSYYINYAPSAKPDPKLQAEASALLASIVLNGSTKAESATCK